MWCTQEGVLGSTGRGMRKGDRKGGVTEQVTTVDKRGSDLLERPGSQNGACLLGNGGGRGYLSGIG